MFAIALDFGLLRIIGVGAIVATVLFLTFHCTFAPRVGAFALTLSIHVFHLWGLKLSHNLGSNVSAILGPMAERGWARSKLMRRTLL
jgi:hypothetical protein